MYFNKTTSYLGYYITRAFRDKLLTPDENLYIFASKTSQWSSTDAPLPASGSVKEFVDIWDELAFIKKCLPADISPIIRNRQWQVNTIYTMYEHDIDLNLIAESNSNSPYYVINRDLRLYKCIYNGASPTNPTGKPSLYEPGVATQINNIVGDPESISFLYYDDGYIWKYMYTISPSDAFRFITRNYIPVRESVEVKQSAIDGTVDVIKIINGGSDYVDGVYYNIPIIKNNNPSETIDVALATITVDGGKIVSAVITYRGSGYRHASINGSVFPPTMIGSNGNGAVLKPIVSPIGGHGYDVYGELSCSSFMVYNIFDNLPDSPPPENITYRRFGLIYNPKDSNGNIFTGSYAEKPQLTPYSGSIFYVENVSPIERSPSQNEVFRLIVRL